MCFVSKDNNKDLVLFYCLETENWFKFQFTDSNNDLLANSSVFAVNKKNGKDIKPRFRNHDSESIMGNTGMTGIPDLPDPTGPPDKVM